MNQEQIAQRALDLHASGKTHEASKFISDKCGDAELSLPVAIAMARMATDIMRHDLSANYWAACHRLDPSNIAFRVNVAASLHEIGDKTTAIKVAKAAIDIAPNNTDALNIMGVITGDTTWYKKALKANPKNFNALNNLAQHCKKAERRRLLKRALEIAPNDMSINVGYALTLFGMGRHADAWPHYEYRLQNQRFSAIYLTEAKRWRGENLTCHSITVFAEQGVGDECMFLTGLGALRGASRVVVACDERLVDLVARAYPWADVVPCIERINNGRKERRADIPDTDYWMPAGDLWRHGNERGVSLHTDRAVEVPDNAIGLCWRSGLAGRPAWPGIDWAEKLVKQNPDKVFINMQYKATKEELERMTEIDNFHVVDGDLFMDIELNVAIANSCSLCVGPATAPMMFARCSGNDVRFVTGCKPWWANMWPGVRWCGLGDVFG